MTFIAQIRKYICYVEYICMKTRVAFVENIGRNANLAT